MKSVRSDKLFRAALLASLINVAYAGGNLFLGITGSSWWFLTIGIYHVLLCIMRLTVMLSHQMKPSEFTPKTAGYFLMATALPLFGIVLISAQKDVGTKFHVIIMITIALFAFSKITLAIVNLIQSNKRRSPIEQVLRNITLADAFVSIASLQRSMLVSFDGMTPPEIRTFNVLTGVGVCIIVFLLGLHLSKSKKNTEF